MLGNMGFNHCKVTTFSVKVSALINLITLEESVMKQQSKAKQSKAKQSKAKDNSRSFTITFSCM